MRRPSPPDELKRLAVAEAIAREWNAASVGYAVVHGLEHYPAQLGRDLDIVIQPESVGPAVALAIKGGREHGFDTVLFRWSHWGLYQLALLNRDSSLALPLDLLCTTRVWRAKWVRIVDQPLLDQLIAGDGRIGPFSVSHAGRFLKSLVRPVLCGDLSRIGTAREWTPPVSLPPKLPRAHLADLLGESLIEELASGGGLGLLRPGIGPRLQHRWIRLHPFGALQSLCEAGIGRFLRSGLDPAAWLVVRSPRSRQRLVVRALEPLIRDASRLFVDVRLVADRGSPLAQFTEAVAGRRPSISEFAVTVVVDVRPSTGSESTRSPRSRFLMQPRTEVVLPDDVSATETRQTVLACLLDFLAASYSPTRFLDDRPEPDTGPSGWKVELSEPR
jgi:hypothetical protein